MKSIYYQWFFALLALAVAIGLLFLSTKAVGAIREQNTQAVKSLQK